MRFAWDLHEKSSISEGVCPVSGILLSVPLLVVHATLMRVLDATLMRVLDAILMRVLDATLMRVLEVTLMRVLDATLMRVLHVTLMRVLGLTCFFFQSPYSYHSTKMKLHFTLK